MYRNQLGRGIIVYAAHHLLASEIEISTKYQSSLWINIKITNNNNIIVGTIYRSPNSDSANNDQLIKLFEEVTKIKHDHILIAGDFNLKQIDWATNTVSGLQSSYQYKVFDAVNDLFLHETIKEPTRLRGSDTPSKLDWILTENPDCVQNICIGPPLGMSDHSLISINYNCITDKDDSDECSSYSYYNGNYNAMRDEFNDINWRDGLERVQTQQAWDLFHNKISGLIERHIPKKKYTSSKRPPWYGREVGNLSNVKRKAWHKYKKNPCDANWSEYTQKRNKLTHKIESLKSAYENKLVLEINQNPKKIWKYISSKTKSKGKISILLDKDGNEKSDDQDKAELLNDHFASVFTREDTSNIPDFEIQAKDVEILDSIVISTEKIKKHLLGLKVSKAPGPDGINGKILRELAIEISPVLRTIYDKSLCEGSLPYQWKEANVIALFKKGSKRSPNNYRPVSLTSICCKILEKMIRDDIVLSLESQGLLHKDQHGFRGGRSCCTQLLEVMEMWTRWIDLGLPWDTIYTDFSKAFDSVPHERLLKKIEAYGIKGNVLAWIRNFLTSRKQRVVLGCKKSDWQDVTSGIPQGSVLGPILFTIFINDMPDIVESSMKLFADDAKIFKAIESFEDISVIQDDIDNLLKWSTIWQLPLNLKKCKCVHYGKNNPCHQFSIGGQCLSEDLTEKDVGVTFDSSLEFRQHIKSMISKANQRVGLIKRSFSHLDIKSVKLLYKSLVRPILEYCSVIWNPIFKTDANEIEKVQARATKLVPSIRNSDYSDRLKALNLTTLAYRRQRTDVLQVYRIIKQIDKIPFDTFFKYSEIEQTRGHSQKLEKPRAATRIRLNSFSHRVINAWNRLPDETVDLEKHDTLNKFKTALEIAWKNHPLKYKYERED